jgi:hypothetical protein
LVGRQPACCTLLVSSFAPPRAELTPEIDALFLDNGARSATSCRARPHLCQDQAAAPEEPGLRASDRHGLVPRQFGSSCTSLGVRGVAHAWPGRILPLDVRGSVRSSGRVARQVSSSWDDLRLPCLCRSSGVFARGRPEGFYSPFRQQYTGRRRLQVSTAVLLSGNSRLRVADWGALQVGLLQYGMRERRCPTVQPGAHSKTRALEQRSCRLAHHRRQAKLTSVLVKWSHVRIEDIFIAEERTGPRTQQARLTAAADHVEDANHSTAIVNPG